MLIHLNFKFLRKMNSTTEQNPKKKLPFSISVILILIINTFIHFITFRDTIILFKALTGSRIIECGLTDIPAFIFFYLFIILIILTLFRKKIKEKLIWYRILLIILGILLAILIAIPIYLEINFQISTFPFYPCEKRRLIQIYYNIVFLVIQISMTMAFYIKYSK